MKTRDKLIAAAERVMRSKGLAQCTTKEIAREAGYSEGTLYKHFDSKSDLFLSVLAERMPDFLDLVEVLPERAGEGTVRRTLEEVAGSALTFYASAMPITASIFAEPELLARHREAVIARGAGPQRANEAVEAYLEAEKELGRVRGTADAAAAASALLGACYYRAFLRNFFGHDHPGNEQEEEFVRSVTEILMPGLEGVRD